MYGCKNYGYTMWIHAGRGHWHPHATAAKACTDSGGLGWLAAMYMLTVVLLGGMVLPTVARI